MKSDEILTNIIAESTPQHEEHLKDIYRMVNQLIEEKTPVIVRKVIEEEYRAGKLKGIELTANLTGSEIARQISKQLNDRLKQ